MRRYVKISNLAVVLLSLCLFYQNVSSAQQNPHVEHITTNDGLSQGMVYDILQDREGFIWIATKDGLNRYDGKEFKVFTNEPSDPWSISGNTIIDLFEDSKGRIWAAAKSAGINIYDKATGRFHHISHDPNDPASLSGDNVTSILEDSSGYFICAVDQMEINMFEVESSLFDKQIAPKVVRISMPIVKGQELLNSQVVFGPKLRALVKDAENRIWVAGKTTMYQLQIGKANLTGAQDSLSFFRASADQEGSFWGSLIELGVFKWKDGKATFIDVNHFGPPRTVLFHEGVLWVLTTRGLSGYKVENEKVQKGSVENLGEPFFHWEPDSLLPYVPFSTIPLYVDQSGLIWIGLGGFGVLKVNPKTSRFSLQSKEESVRNFFENQDGTLATQDFLGVWYNTDGSYVDMEMFDISKNKVISADILTSNEESYWVKYSNSIYSDKYKSLISVKKFNSNTGQSKEYALSWHQDILQPMVETKDGSLWLSGFDDVLTQVDPKSDDLIFYNSKTGEILDIDVRESRPSSLKPSTAIYEDIDGVLWVGSERGFSKCIRPSQRKAPLEVLNYSNTPDDDNSLSYNHVTSFLDDPKYPKQYLWISTQGGGLNRLNKETGKVLRFNMLDGLPNDVVYGLLSDGVGNIWGSTNKGVFCMSARYTDGSVDDVSYSFRTFSKHDGLQENEFNTGAYKKLSDGRLAFGGIVGYNIFDPKEVLKDQFVPVTYITNVLVNNQLIKTGDSTGILEKTIQSTEAIKLSPIDNVLTLEFAALDFTAPD